MLNPRIDKIDQSDREALERLFQLYVYDLSELLGNSVASSGDYSFNKDQLDLYWLREDHVPYFIRVGEELAGFVLIRKYPANPQAYDVEQFFVMRKFRRGGVGLSVFRKVTSLYQGQWQVRVLKENVKALEFWCAAVEKIVGSDYSLSEEVDIDFAMQFLKFSV